jgi:pimeloyl-ACP methyl ester carboxylesterase
MLQFKDWPEEALRSINTPTLIISGDHDVVLPEHTVAMAKLIRNSRLMILPAGHGAYIGVEGTNPESKMPGICVEAIEEFLGH